MRSSLTRGPSRLPLDWRCSAAIVSGLAPAIQSSRPDLNETLKESGRGTSAGRSRQRVRSVLVVSELALALVLLIGAGLMVTGVKSLLAVRQPYDPQHVLSILINLPDSKYKDRQTRAAFYGQVLEQLRSVPEIEAAAMVRSLPYGDGHRIVQLGIEGVPVEKGEYRSAQSEIVSADYFSLMRIPLREGRLLGERDGAESSPVAVVSERMARRYWPGASALGRRIKAGAADSDQPWLTIVGVVGEIQYDWLDREPPPVLYRSYRQAAEGWTTLAVRTHGDPMRVVTAVRSRGGESGSRPAAGGDQDARPRDDRFGARVVVRRGDDDRAGRDRAGALGHRRSRA